MFLKVHCLFEQSGTFKREFQKLGLPAFDYDISNDFNQTDFVVDLFNEIDKAFLKEPSIFDSFSRDDLIMAFFPCVRFESQILLGFRGQSHGMEKWPPSKKILNCLRLHQELSRFYELVSRLFLVCLERGLKMVLENPYSEEHYLRRYWCLPATFIDYDRRQRGDYFKKPTQYWFVNFEPSYNFLFESHSCNSIGCKDAIRFIGKEHYQKTGAKNKKVARSMIHPDYANRFIREFLL